MPDDLQALLDRIRERRDAANLMLEARDLAPSSAAFSDSAAEITEPLIQDNGTLLALMEKAQEVMDLLGSMNAGVAQVPPPITDRDKLYALKDALAAYRIAVAEAAKETT